jgi:phosphate transport system substrate-binding protein
MNTVKKSIILLILFSTLIAGCFSGSGTENSPDNPSSTQNLFVENKGSDTIVNVALAWAEAYQHLNPDIRISVTGGGSGTGIAALINNTVDIANASRQIKQIEIDDAMENGVTPVEFIIAGDAIAIIVNKENPVSELTIQQISDIYSGKITNWSEVGGEDRPIVKLSRETNSGTHVYFLQEVVRQGDKNSTKLFSQDTLLLPSSEGIIVEVRDNPNAIGYDGLGYISDDVKVIAVAINYGDAYIIPSIESVLNKQYPIARNLYMYTNGVPDSHVKEYLDWVLSEEAQQIVAELGFVPIADN